MQKIKLTLIHKYILVCFFSIISFFFIVKHINKKKEEEKKAIILVPGIGASELFYNSTNNKNYFKGEAIFFPNKISLFNINQFAEDLEKIINNLEILECDEKGVPINRDVGLLKDIDEVKTREKNLHDYGNFLLFKEIKTLLNSIFMTKNKHKEEIIFFNYDWRLSCNINGDLLTKLINKYDKVTLIGYSMGGLISCKAMCNLFKKSKLDKIENYISISVPYNGSALALYALLTGIIEDNNFLNFFYKSLECDKKVKNLLKNYPSIYELLPTEEYFARSKGFLKNNTGVLLNYPETIDFIEKNQQLNSSLLKKAVSFHKDLFMKQKHILEYVKNKYFFIGTGYDTTSELKLGKDIKISKYELGDNTVEMQNSAIPPIKDIQNLNIYKIKTSHRDILNNKQFLTQLKVLLKKILEKNKYINIPK